METNYVMKCYKLNGELDDQDARIKCIGLEFSNKSTKKQKEAIYVLENYVLMKYKENVELLEHVLGYMKNNVK